MTKIFLYIHIPRCIGIGRTGDGVLKHRTPSKRLILERARCVEFCHISSGWFKHIEPHRTPSKRMIPRCVEFFHISSGWFKHIEPHRTPSKHMILERARCAELCQISSGWFQHIEPHRTPSKHIILERARCVELCPISSGWFKHIEPHRTPSKLERGRCVERCQISSGWFKHYQHCTGTLHILLTLVAHARGLLYLSCVYVCLSPSVPALATLLQRPANNDTHGCLLGFSWILTREFSKKPSVRKLWREKGNMQMS